jgi:hypothetical protein
MTDLRATIEQMVGALENARPFVFDGSVRYYDGTNGDRIRASAKAFLTRIDLSLTAGRAALSSLDAPKVELSDAEIDAIENRIYCKTIEKGKTRHVYLQQYARAIIAAINAKGG